MSKLSSAKKIILEDLPSEHRGWFAKVADPLNRFLEQVYAALVNGITIRDNLKAQAFKIIIREGETYKTVSWTLNERPTAVLLAQIRTSAGMAPTTAHNISWQFINGNIEIDFIGLNALTRYNATVVGIV